MPVQAMAYPMAQNLWKPLPEGLYSVFPTRLTREGLNKDGQKIAPGDRGLKRLDRLSDCLLDFAVFPAFRVFLNPGLFYRPGGRNGIMQHKVYSILGSICLFRISRAQNGYFSGHQNGLACLL